MPVASFTIRADNDEITEFKCDPGDLPYAMSKTDFDKLLYEKYGVSAYNYVMKNNDMIYNKDKGPVWEFERYVFFVPREGLDNTNIVVWVGTLSESQEDYLDSQNRRIGYKSRTATADEIRRHVFTQR